jgi:hypothetical protein
MTVSVAQNLNPEMFSTLMLTVKAAAAVAAPAGERMVAGAWLMLD